MKATKLIRILAIVLAVGIIMAGCSSGGSKSVDITKMSIDQLKEQAKKEGRISSVGMPPDWANWVESWDAIQSLYSVQHEDLDMSSSEELATFENEKASPTKDVGDVGQAFGTIAVERGVVQPYKASTWDSIPDWAKDPDGNWAISYIGTISFIANNKVTEDQPKSWADLRNGTCKFSTGDVIRAANAQASFLSANFAFGGTLDDIEPGIQFFKEMATQGRLDPGDVLQNRFVKGEIECAAGWDYNFLQWRDLTEEADPTAKVYLHIPQDGAARSGYCLVINKWAPHPAAAALTIEYMFSDAGQIDRARGYARPIRDVAIPADVKAKMLPDEQYANATPISDNNAWKSAAEEVSVRWEEEIVPLITK